MNNSNLLSPTKISKPCNLLDLNAWVKEQAIEAIENEVIRNIVLIICTNLDTFVNFPHDKKSILLLNGCDRENPVMENGKKQKTKYHKFPEKVIQMAKEKNITPDPRANGPAVTAFKLAGGKRPKRMGSTNEWTVHHLYSGKFPYYGREATLHAAKNGKHFTQSAGLVAIHPIADQICDEYPFFSWFLRAKAFVKFGYDPDEVFYSDGVDDYGFVSSDKYEIIERCMACDLLIMKP